MPAIGEISVGSKLGYVNRGRFIWAACETCGKERWVKLLYGLPTQRRCVRCSTIGKVGELHNSWNGGRKMQGGYVLVYLLPADEFFQPMAGRNHCVPEHRLVMAKHLSRCLLSWEVVHHRNGIRDDNRIENLQLLPSRAYHISDTLLKQRVRQLEIQMVEQKKYIKLLEWHIKELNKKVIKEVWNVY